MAFLACFTMAYGDVQGYIRFRSFGCRIRASGFHVLCRVCEVSGAALGLEIIVKTPR